MAAAAAPAAARRVRAPDTIQDLANGVLTIQQKRRMVSDVVGPGRIMTRLGLETFIKGNKELRQTHNPDILDLPVIPELPPIPRIGRFYFRSDVYLPKRAKSIIEADFAHVLVGYRPHMKRCGTGHPILRFHKEYSRMMVLSDYTGYDKVLNYGSPGHAEVYYHAKVHVLAPTRTDLEYTRHSFVFRDNNHVTKCNHSFSQSLAGQQCICNPTYRFSQDQVITSYEWTQGNDNNAPHFKTHGLDNAQIHANNGGAMGANLVAADDVDKRGIFFHYTSYGIDIRDIGKMMVRGSYGRATAVVYKFNGRKGKFFDEAVWTKDANGTVTMYVKEGYGKQDERDTQVALTFEDVDELFDGLYDNQTRASYRGVSFIDNGNNYKLVWNKIRETSIDATFSFHIVPANTVLTPVVSVKQLQDEYEVKERDGIIATTKDKIIKKYALVNAQGIKMQPIARDLNGLLQKQGVELTSKELTTIINDIFLETYLIKKEFAETISKSYHLYESVDKQMKTPGGSLSNLSLGHEDDTEYIEDSMATLMAKFGHIFPKRMKEFSFNLKLTTAFIMVLAFGIMVYTIYNPLVYHEDSHGYDINIHTLKIGSYGVHWNQYLLIIITVGLMLLYIMNMVWTGMNFSFTDTLNKALDNWDMPFQDLVHKIDLKLRKIVTTEVIVLIFLVCALLIPHFSVAIIVIFLGFGLIIFEYNTSRMTTLLAMQSLIRKTRGTDGVEKHDIYFNVFIVTMICLILGKMLIRWLTKGQVFVGIKNYVYEIGELIIYGECALLESNVWRDMDPNNTLTYNKQLWETQCDWDVPRRPSGFCYGPHAINHKPRVSTNCVHNEVHCLMNRELFDLDKYSKRKSLKLIDKLFSWVSELPKETFEHPYTEMGFDEWTANIQDPKKRQRAVDANLKRDFDPSKDGGTDAFIKKEFITGKTKSEEPDAKDSYAARLIQATNAFINNAMGPYTYTMVKILKYLWHPEHYITYASGMNRKEIGEWYDRAVSFVSSEGDPVCYASDFSKFDKHHTIKHLQLEHNIFNLILPMSELTKQAYESTLKTKGTMPMGTKYTCDATRKSGYQDTTVGNTLLNGISLLYTLMVLFTTILGFTSFVLDDLYTLPVRIIVLGDDCYMITTREIANQLMEMDTLEHLGWDVKKEIGPLSQHTFCSSIFMPSKQGTVLTPLPARALSKTFICKKQMVKVDQQKYYAHVVANGLLCDNRHNPLVRQMFRRIKYLTRDHGVTKFGFMEDHYSKYQSFEKFKGNLDECEATYSFIAERYNVSKEDLDDLEKYYDSIPSFKVGLDHPVIQRMLDIDNEVVHPDVFERQRGKYWDVVDYQEQVPVDPIDWWDALYRSE